MLNLTFGKRQYTFCQLEFCSSLSLNVSRNSCYQTPLIPLSTLECKEQSLRKKCPYSELFWSVLFPDFPAFGLNMERYGVCKKSGKNADQNNFEYGLYLRMNYFENALLELICII